MMRQSNFLFLFPALALGIYFGSRSMFHFGLLLVFLLCLLTWFILAYRGVWQKGSRLLFWLVILLGTSLLGQLNLNTKMNWQVPVEGEFSGQVFFVRDLSFDKRVFVKLRSPRSQVAVHLPLEADVKPGDNLLFTGIIAQPPQAPNPGVFCYRSYLASQGIYGVSYPASFNVNKNTNKSWLRLVRQKIRANLEKNIHDPGLPIALLLGDRDALPASRRKVWQDLGLAHLLAISGMHVGFLALVAGLVMKRLPVPPWLQLICGQIFLLIYIIVAGNSVSTWRAFFFSLLAALAGLRGKKVDSLHIWALVGFVVLLLKPHLLFDVSFLLSFAASGSILLWNPNLKIKSKNKFTNYLFRSLAVSCIAQIGTAPIVLNYFGEIALLGPFSTLVFVPLVVILLFASLGVAIGLGPFGFGAIINHTMLVVEALETLLMPFAGKWAPVAAGKLEIFFWWGLFIYAGWQLRQPKITKPRRTYHKLVWALVVVFTITSLPPAVLRPFELTAINVGQGDSYLLKTPSGRHILVDGGGDSLYWQERGRNVGKERLVPYLEHRKVPKLDYVILSHPHEDHLFGLLAVLEHFEVETVIDNGHSINSPSYWRYLDLIAEKGISHLTVKAGEQLKLGDGITIDILYPEQIRPELPSAHNNNSLLVRVKYGGMAMLFTGDLEIPVLYDLVHYSNVDLEAQWLKVPHHGSKGSFLVDFYRAVKPKWAVVSVGPNSFGHPHQEVIDYLNKQQIKWETTEKGPVTFLVWWGLWGRLLAP